jgi:hypothetical protein
MLWAEGGALALEQAIEYALYALREEDAAAAGDAWA